MTHSGNDRFFTAMLRNDFHPLTKKHPMTAFESNRSSCKFLEHFNPPDRTDSKQSLLSARSHLSIASRMANHSTRNPKKPTFQASFTSIERRRQETRSNDTTYKKVHRSETLKDLNEHKRQMRLEKERELHEFRNKMAEEKRWALELKKRTQKSENDVKSFRRTMQKEDQEMRREADMCMKHMELMERVEHVAELEDQASRNVQNTLRKLDSSRAPLSEIPEIDEFTQEFTPDESRIGHTVSRLNTTGEVPSMLHSTDDLKSPAFVSTKDEDFISDPNSSGTKAYHSSGMKYSNFSGMGQVLASPLEGSVQTIMQMNDSLSGSNKSWSSCGPSNAGGNSAGVPRRLQPSAKQQAAVSEKQQNASAKQQLSRGASSGKSQPTSTKSMASKRGLRPIQYDANGRSIRTPASEWSIRTPASTCSSTSNMSLGGVLNSINMSSRQSGNLVSGQSSLSAVEDTRNLRPVIRGGPSPIL